VTFSRSNAITVLSRSAATVSGIAFAVSSGIRSTLLSPARIAYTPFFSGSVRPNRSAFEARSFSLPTCTTTRSGRSRPNGASDGGASAANSLTRAPLRRSSSSETLSLSAARGVGCVIFHF
jgi:hypothetical protein